MSLQRSMRKNWTASPSYAAMRTGTACIHPWRKEIPDIYVTSSVSNLLEMGHKDAGKGKTLLWLLDKLGISPEEAMAFGDADNDSSMLEAVKYGIAMGNATENCKKSAACVTGTNEEDGVAEAILSHIKCEI